MSAVSRADLKSKKALSNGPPHAARRGPNRTACCTISVNVVSKRVGDEEVNHNGTSRSLKDRSQSVQPALRSGWRKNLLPFQSLPVTIRKPASLRSNLADRLPENGDRFHRRMSDRFRENPQERSRLS